ncbi:3-alpha-hydroxycholanate dehydrogenase (NADP(+)) [Sinobacterium norvegicum]|uniref:3-alpha-hydroxycholanate dehydrogenase (NADP(+)) n=1 Tax=Sinobacterium norvegicum TaxID=1641715 RepID=A0ABM9ACP6_9GAMM|nr:SDR family oxidoreductase [Sinobacterium norvegicum]CAH0990960.1 3-alpha-hydroxycholanate dehydrogenase (NADP(+)) [Sinobacterium norvegicum]
MHYSLSNKVYIVTGGSRGFGLSMAKALLAAGASVGITGRSKDSMQQAIEILTAEHDDYRDRVCGELADVADSGQVEQAFDNIVQRFGRLDGLVNNAGLARVASTENMVDEEIKLQINTNLLGVVYCCRMAIRYLREVDNGRIINISSATAYHHDEMVHMAVYAATKSAVERFSRDLRRELEGDAIGVSIIRPGASMATDFSAGLDFDRLGDALKAWQDLGPHTYDGMEPEHVADAVVYCLSCPPGLAIDLLEIRPHHKIDKVVF